MSQTKPATAPYCSGGCPTSEYRRPRAMRTNLAPPEWPPGLSSMGAGSIPNRCQCIALELTAEVASSRRDAARRELTAEIVSVRRELLTARSEAEQLRVANADLQHKLQEGDATVTSLKAHNADLQRQLEALNNISAFLAGVARGEHNDKS
jgi:hypothetical protein